MSFDKGAFEQDITFINRIQLVSRYPYYISTVSDHIDNPPKLKEGRAARRSLLQRSQCYKILQPISNRMIRACSTEKCHNIIYPTFSTSCKNKEQTTDDAKRATHSQ
jgi:hypothetical protein